MPTYGIDRQGGAGGSGSALNPIDQTLIDAKGDLIVGTAADAVDNLTVGANETRVVADSTQATGLKYVADTTNYAVAAKGDLLAGTAADTVAALTVGANDTFPIADSAQSTGLKYGTVNSFTEDTSPDLGADFILTYDVSGATSKKVLLGRAGAGVLGTEQAATSGTAINFTGIPSWAKKIIIQFFGVSTSGTSVPIVQLGHAGNIEATGYLGAANLLTEAGAVQATNFTTGIGLAAAWAATTVVHGTATLTLEDAANFTWIATVNLGMSNTAQTASGGASKALSAALDRVRITTVGGSDTFDAGAINILYE